MFFFTSKHSQNSAQKISHQTKLNPLAPEYYPNLITPHFTQPLHFYPPQPLPQPVVNIFYRHQIFPQISPLKSVYCSTGMNLSPPPKPTPGPTREGRPGRRDYRRRPSNQGRVTSTGSGTSKWFWAKKEAINHPVALASNYPFGDSTSLMIRNIPVRFSRMELMELLDEHCKLENEKISASDDGEVVVSEFDYLYLPIDFQTKGNLGYAFVNFTTWVGAARLYSSWNGQQWENCPYKTKKIRQICRAQFQGKHELKNRFLRSKLPFETEEYLPVEISPPRNGTNSDITNISIVGKGISK